MISNTSDTRESNPHALLAQARRHVRRQLPGAFEASDHMAGMITYAYGGELSDMACMVAPHGGGLMIGFYNADELGGSAGMLRRQGIRHRYLEIARLEDLCAPALRELLGAVRRRHGDSAAALDEAPEHASGSPPRPVRSDLPAGETLICLLVGLIVGAVLAELSESPMAGLTMGMLFAFALLWVSGSRKGSSG